MTILPPLENLMAAHVLRIPNPGSDIDGFIRIFQALYEQLGERDAFTLDDMSETLVERNLATSCGRSGAEALERSTRTDRSRDPLYNQSKMYSELFKVLGWIHPLGDNKLIFRFTFFGAHVAEAKRDAAAIFRQSVLGIVYPNNILDVKGSSKVRPFATILRSMAALGGLLSRDEMIVGPLNIEDDRDDTAFEKMVHELKQLRTKAGALEAKLEKLSQTRKITQTTMENYTRFPLAALSWCGWATVEKVAVGGKKPSHYRQLTKEGQSLADWIKSVKDVRAYDLEKVIPEVVAALCRGSFYETLSRSGFETTPVQAMLNTDAAMVTKQFGVPLSQILFSPFQEFNSEQLAASFPEIRSAAATSITSADGITHATPQLDVKLKTTVELKKSVTPQVDLPDDIALLFKTAKEKTNDFESTIDSLFQHFGKANKAEFYPLIAKLFKTLGYDCENSRVGVNYQRADAFIRDAKESIPIEIKSPGEEAFISVKGVRQALENKVILLARGAAKTEKHTTSLLVGYNLPNNRSEVNELIADIYATFDLVVGVIDFRSLLKMVGETVLLGRGHNKEQLVRLHGIIELADA